MKVLFVASEAVPFMKSGGLGDVAGALPTISGSYAVREALEKGLLEKSRYESYLRMYEAASQLKPWEMKERGAL